jgi:hypothetical protein
MPKTFALPLSIRRNIENSYHQAYQSDKLGKHWSCGAGDPLSVYDVSRWQMIAALIVFSGAQNPASPA